MARRNGRKGQWLITDDYTGFTKYSSEVKRDYWGNYTKKPLIRNLQEIAKPLYDPEPVAIYRGPSYESVRKCISETLPLYVGNTNIPTPTTSPAAQALHLRNALGDMEIGCTFIVY